MTDKKIMITDYDWPDVEIEKRIISEAGYELIISDCETEEEIIAEAADKNVGSLIVQYAPVTEKVFANLSELQGIVRYGIGYDVFDIEAATNYGICAMNVENYCEEEVANHTLSLMLAMNRKLLQLDSQVKKGDWDVHAVGDMERFSQKTVGLFGFGDIARKVAERLDCFEAEILFYDPYIDSKYNNARKVNFKDLITQSDIISIHSPLTDETESKMAREEFTSMKNSAFIINTARGPIIDENSLIDSLKKNEIAGAALDVLEEEPIEKDNPLKKMENVILTPHAGWHSSQAMKELKTRTAEQAVAVLEGEKPEFLINVEAWENQ